MIGSVCFVLACVVVLLLRCCLGCVGCMWFVLCCFVLFGVFVVCFVVCVLVLTCFVLFGFCFVWGVIVCWFDRLCLLFVLFCVVSLCACLCVCLV